MAGSFTKNFKAGPDFELLARLRSGDDEAYSHAVRQFHGSMFRLARAMVGETDAAEVVQDAWVAMIGSLSGFEGRSRLHTWILSIVANTARAHLRRAASRRTESLDTFAGSDDPDFERRFDYRGNWITPPLPWHEETPEALLAQHEMLACIERTLLSLPRQQREILILRDLEGLEMTEICTILKVSHGNARVSLHRARERIRAAVENLEREGKC